MKPFSKCLIAVFAGIAVWMFPRQNEAKIRVPLLVEDVFVANPSPAIEPQGSCLPRFVLARVNVRKGELDSRSVYDMVAAGCGNKSQPLSLRKSIVIHNHPVGRFFMRRFIPHPGCKANNHVISGSISVIHNAQTEHQLFIMLPRVPDFRYYVSSLGVNRTTFAYSDAFTHRNPLFSIYDDLSNNSKSNNQIEKVISKKLCAFGQAGPGNSNDQQKDEDPEGRNTNPLQVTKRTAIAITTISIIGIVVGLVFFGHYFGLYLDGSKRNTKLCVLIWIAAAVFLAAVALVADVRANLGKQLKGDTKVIDLPIPENVEIATLSVYDHQKAAVLDSRDFLRGNIGHCHSKIEVAVCGNQDRLGVERVCVPIEPPPPLGWMTLSYAYLYFPLKIKSGGLTPIVELPLNGDGIEVNKEAGGGENDIYWLYPGEDEWLEMSF